MAQGLGGTASFDCPPGLLMGHMARTSPFSLSPSRFSHTAFVALLSFPPRATVTLPPGSAVPDRARPTPASRDARGTGGRKKQRGGIHGTANGSTSPPHPTPPPPLLSLLSLLLLRLSRALTTLPTPSDLRFTLLTIIAISPLMGLFASWAHAFYLPQAGFPIPLILFVFVFPSFWEELFWRVLLNPHPAEPPSTLPSWLHTRITSLLSRASSLLAPFLSSIPFLRALSLPRDWPADPKVSGSAWAAILVHWMAVSVWMCLGGRHQAPF
ncbi:unnamed protein product [Closterium sp. NIES-64]|nr:unnamed protein product [Closterium sp. NIES-64]